MINNNKIFSSCSKETPVSTDEFSTEDLVSYDDASCSYPPFITGRDKTLSFGDVSRRLVFFEENLVKVQCMMINNRLDKHHTRRSHIPAYVNNSAEGFKASFIEGLI